jgi:hypothetical protein
VAGAVPGDLLHGEVADGDDQRVDQHDQDDSAQVGESAENVASFSSFKMLSSRPSRILPETTIRHLRRSEGDFQHFEFGALVL